MASEIVVPLDGSPAAEAALPFASMLARRLNVPLMLTSVVAVTGEFATWLNTGVRDQDREIGAWVEHRRVYLKSLTDMLGRDNVHAHVSVGRPTSMLVEFIDSREDPLVVLASHGESRPGEGNVGRHTFRLIHHLATPMIVIKNRDGRAAMPTDDITRIVMPLDDSDFSAHALEGTLALFGDLRPSLHLVTVIDNKGSNAGIQDTKLVDDYLQSIREAHGGSLQERAAELTRRGYTTTWEVREGTPEDEIAASAIDANASMIAMATHGRSGIAHALLGSVAEGVLIATNHPLLLSRPNED
jgi:nucleotide-binding universal stress UspA family protein